MKKERIPKDQPWLHVIPDINSKASQLTIRQATIDHLSKYGINLYEHEGAFTPVKDTKTDGEQFSGKYHVYVTFDEKNIPTDPTYGLWYFPESFRRLIITTQEAPAKIWFKPEVLIRNLNICSICYLNKDRACKGHDTINKAKRQSAQAANEAAKRRIQANIISA